MTPVPDTPITADESREIDRRATCDYEIPGVLLMEHASLGASHLALDLLESSNAGARGRVVILAGPGNNGGDGLAVARHLHLAGHEVQVIEVSGAPQPDSDAAIQRRIVDALGIPSTPLTAPIEADLIIDGIFGTGLTRPPRGPARDAIEAANAADARRLALDVPSGLDSTTGDALDVVFRADATVTFAAVKAGLVEPGASEYVGELFIAPIGAPATLLPDGSPRFPPTPRPVRH